MQSWVLINSNINSPYNEPPSQLKIGVLFNRNSLTQDKDLTFQ